MTSNLMVLFYVTLVVGGLTACQVSPSEDEFFVSCKHTSQNKIIPQNLSQSCLYSNLNNFSISSELHKFTPNYQLWSDGAHKSRWIYLPTGKQINTDDPDRWVFPVGTQFFKEFRKTITIAPGINQEIKVETRHLMKIHRGTGIDAWSLVTYLWQENQQDAQLVLDGAQKILKTNHNIPSQEDCMTCHKGNVDIILGFDSIQLSDRQLDHSFGHGPGRIKGEWTLGSLLKSNRLSNLISQPALPGNSMEQKVLGYLHANCGNCHNPLGHAADQEAKHLRLRHKIAFKTVEETDVYRTAVNQTTKNFTLVPYIIMGAKHEEMALYQSALYVRINSVDEEYRMPMIARNVVDYAAAELIHRWMLTLPTPEDFNFGFNQRKTEKPKITEKQIPLEFTAEKGLQVNIQFELSQDVPPVMIIYWPEDKKLNSNSIMDHVDGDFTEKLIVGNKGSMMSLRNSDDVGHTIYVKDKRRDIKWQLNYMPPGSAFQKNIFWDKDTFVEMRCRLHLYMSAWVGSITSRYYKIFELKEGQRQIQVTMSDYPEDFRQLKIWMPKIQAIDTQILPGENKHFSLKVGSKIKGILDIQRLPK